VHSTLLHATPGLWHTLMVVVHPAGCRKVLFLGPPLPTQLLAEAGSVARTALRVNGDTKQGHCQSGNQEETLHASLPG
jgi:hypothetical protein